MSTLITNVSSFVGFHLCRKLLSKGENVIGLYANPTQIETLKSTANAHHLTLIKVALSDAQKLQQIVNQYCPSTLYHFSDFDDNAAQASQTLSFALNILEACKNSSVTHCILNSSSAVYLPHQYSEMASNELSEHPQSLPAATARACELLTHSYSFQYGLPCTVVRLFQVYGGKTHGEAFSHSEALQSTTTQSTATQNTATPNNLVATLWQKVKQHDSINLADYGSALMDFTYIDDVCNALFRLQEHPATPNPQWQLDEEFMDSSTAPWRIYNIGTGKGTSVFSLLEAIAEVQGQPLNVVTHANANHRATNATNKVQPESENRPFQHIANVEPLLQDTGYQPRTRLYDGLRQMLTDV